MKESNPQTVLLKDYQKPDFMINHVELAFDLFEDYATVKSSLSLKKMGSAQALVLNGEDLELTAVAINGKKLEASAYKTDSKFLTIHQVPSETFELTIETKIYPQKNLALEGLYKSQSIFCTQCEAEGFRKITYFLDRPDVMTVYTVSISADTAKYPFLLSNGNLIESRELSNGRHFAKWNDPHPKPCYLFALVAGDLGRVEDFFTTRSGRKVKLQIFVDKGNEDRTAHAMESLKKSMKWDEDTFGREYDLDIFMIVAVDDFNAGAMENKGLNIFNSHYVLAKPTTATDGDYEGIQDVIAHEYFHNWTGNRITCRDWFQLSLKEGLTVYRDQEFSADMTSRAVKRIDDASFIRSFQFPEDAGPMAHPIRPASYIEINNFYTRTVYEKGAEVIRMIANILGKDGFRKGMDKYFELFDGQAVTTEDFIHAMEVANGVDLKQFQNTWYNQAGTPELRIHGKYDASAKRLVMEVEQTCAPTPGQAEKKPFHLPFAFAILGKGKVYVEKTLQITKQKEEFIFEGIDQKPYLSLLRGFSAPVKVKYDFTDEEQIFLFENDSDYFARWEAGKNLAERSIQSLIDSDQAKWSSLINPAIPEAFLKVLSNESIDPAFRARLFRLPDEQYLALQQKTIDVDRIHAAREFLARAIATKCETKLVELFDRYHHTKPYRFDPVDSGSRELKKVALASLVALDRKYSIQALALFEHSNNMTDEMAGFSALVDGAEKEWDLAVNGFYKKWQNDSLVLNKWFSMQALRSEAGGLARIQALLKHPQFSLTNPNKARSLLVTFAMFNPTQFHAIDGSSYRFFADIILDLDKKNPSLAAALSKTFNQWKRYDEKRRNLMKAELERLIAVGGLSPGVFEVISKALQ